MDTLIVHHFRHLRCQWHVSAHVISSPRSFALNTIQDEKCQSFLGNPQAADYYCRVEDPAETFSLRTRPFHVCPRREGVSDLEVTVCDLQRRAELTINMYGINMQTYGIEIHHGNLR